MLHPEIVQFLGLALDFQRSGQQAFRFQTFLDRFLHLLPDGRKIFSDLRTFRKFHVFREVQRAEQTEFHDFRK